MNDHSFCKYCSKCDVRKTSHIRWDECIIYKCTHCYKFWYVCELHNQRFASSRVSVMNRHFTKYHSQPIKKNMYSESAQTEMTSIDNINYNAEDSADLLQCDHSNSTHHCIPTHDTMMEHIQKYSCISSYFEDELGHNGYGLNNIVSNAFTQTNQPNAPISHDEALFHIDVCDLLLKLKSSQQHQLLRILNNAKVTSMQSTRIPRSLADVRNFYTENQKSIIQNMPIPNTFEYDNHVCVTINDIINHVLLLGIDVPMMTASAWNTIITDNTTLLNTNIAQEILKDVSNTHQDEVDPYVIFIMLWSDDFEVNHTRKNKSSTWLKTVTLVAPNCSATSENHTHALCLGSKKSNHDKVNAMFNKELQELNTIIYRYIPKLKQVVPSVVRVLAYLADRPERNAMNDLTSHTAAASKRWIYSSLYDPYKLVSCPQCFQNRVYKMFGHIHDNDIQHCVCYHCCDFNYTEMTHKHTMEFNLPANHPNHMVYDDMNSNDYKHMDIHECMIYNNASIGKGKPVELSYQLLCSSLKYGMYHYIKKTWSKKETIVYLKMLCIKADRIVKSMHEVETTYNTTNNVIQTIQELNMPPMWSSTMMLDQFLDTPMHQLFEGLVKSSLEILSQFMKFHKKWTKFAKLINEMVEDVATLRLGFCKCEPLTNHDDFKGGGWLAETYLGYSRFMVIIIGYIDDILPQNTVGLTELKAFHQCLYSLLSHLMTRKQNDVSIISDHIKLFLSVAHYYEKAIGFPTNVSNVKLFPLWYRRSNFVSLLNLPKQIEKYGPVRLYWEGHRERYIQVIKPILANKRTSVSYLQTKLKKVYKLSTFGNVLQNKIDNEKVKDYKRFEDLKVYYNITKLNKKAKDFESIGGIILQNKSNTVITIVKTENVFLGYEVIVQVSKMFYKCNLPFFPISLSEHPIMKFSNKSDIVNSTSDYVMIIPFIPGNSKTHSNGYAFLTKNWTFLNEKNEIKIYQPNIKELQRIAESNL